MADYRIPSLDEMFSLVIRASDALQDAALQNTMIQSFAYRLMDDGSVPRSEMRQLLSRHGFVMEEFCTGCNEHMPNYSGTSEPICDDCQMDIDSVS